MKSRLTLFAICATFLFAANAQENQETVAPAEGSGAFDPLAGYKANYKVTTLEFDVYEHDFGDIYQDSENDIVFKFRNTGEHPLIIESAKGSCGCTVPHFPREAIMPGEEGEIYTIYKPGKQKNTQVKSITIKANTDPGSTILKLIANVLEAENDEVKAAVLKKNEQVQKDRPEMETAPASIGYTGSSYSDPLGSNRVEGPTTTIEFNTYEHDFGEIYQGSENDMIFKFKNIGDTPLIIENAKGSCGCTVPFFPKDPIMPGEVSEIHAVDKPGKQKGPQNKTITITGNTEPSVTLLKVKAYVNEVDSVKEASLIVQAEQFEKDRAAIESTKPGCFVIFPNPTSNELQLDLKEHIGRSANVRIHNELGADMLEKRIEEISSETTRFDVSSFPGGIYIISITVDGQKPMAQCFVVADN